MKNNDPVIEKIRDWGKIRKNIFGILLTGSRANPKVEPDIFSDYDVVLITNDLPDYRDRDNWLEDFGKILVMFRDTIKNPRIGNIDTYTRLVQYKNGMRIDFSLWSVEFFSHIKNLEKLPDFLNIGYRIILDNRTISKDFKKPEFRGYKTKKPEKEEYKKNTNDFWWDLIYVAKALKRDEVYFSKFMMEKIQFELVLRMVEWYIAMTEKWVINPGKSGRHLKKLLPENEWHQLSSTFTGMDKKDNWRCLFGMADFYRKIAKRVADGLKFVYPDETDKGVMKYINDIKNKENIEF